MDFWAWFPFSLIATTCFGVSSAFYKMPGVKGHSRHSTAFWLFAAGSVLATIFFYKDLGGADSRTLLLGAAWGIAVGLLTSLQMYGLKHIDTHTLFPVGTTGSLVLTILVGLSVFHESLSLLQGAGIALTILAVYLFLYEKGRFRFQAIMLAVLPAIIMLSVFGKIVQKIAVDGGGLGLFIAGGYISAAVISLFMFIAMEGKRFRNELFSNAAWWGMGNGTLGFFGTWTIMLALERGPFTLITSIHSMYIFVAALVAHYFFRETLRRKTVGLIALSVVAVVLMRMH